mgnify:CR=1 FL=1
MAAARRCGRLSDRSGRLPVPPAPIVEGDRLWYCSNQCRVVCADTDGFANGNQGFDKEQYKDKTDVDIIWELDMLKDLGVFPHNLTVCSPLIVGDILYVITANGVDAEHINIPSPEAPSFIAIDKKGRFGAAGTGSGFQYSATSSAFSKVLQSPGLTSKDVGPVGGNQK